MAKALGSPLSPSTRLQVRTGDALSFDVVLGLWQKVAGAEDEGGCSRIAVLAGKLLLRTSYAAGSLRRGRTWPDSSSQEARSG